MARIYLSLLIFSVLFLNACKQNQDKTEIKIYLSESEYLIAMAVNVDSVFITACNEALKIYDPDSSDFATPLMNKLIEINPEASMAQYYLIIEFRDNIDFSTSNEQVINVLNEDVKLAIEKTVLVLKKRLESAFISDDLISNVFNKVEVTIKQLPEKNTYSFVINRKTDEARITKLLQSQTDFGFWETYSLPEIWEFLAEANTFLKETLDKENPTIFENEDTITDAENPLFSILIPSVSQDGNLNEGDVIGVSRVSDTALVNMYLAMSDLNNIFPRDLKFVWESKPVVENTDYIQLIAVKISTRTGQAPLTGEYIVEAEAKNSKGFISVNMKLDSDGSRRFYRMTQENIGKQIAIVINNEVYSNPMVSMEIEGGNVEITGNFTREEAVDLAALLNAGPMPPIPVQVLSMY